MFCWKTPFTHRPALLAAQAIVLALVMLWAGPGLCLMLSLDSDKKVQPQQNYDPGKDSLRVVVADLTPHLKDESNWIKRMFVDHDDFSLCTVTASFSKWPDRRYRTILYSNTKSGEEYQYEAVAAGYDKYFPISEALPLSPHAAINLEIEIRRWKGKENKALLKKILAATAQDGPLSAVKFLPAAQKAQDIGQGIFDVIEMIFDRETNPRKATLPITIELGDLLTPTKKVILTDSDGNAHQIFQLHLQRIGGIFEQGTFTQGMGSPRLESCFPDRERRRWEREIKVSTAFAKKVKDNEGLLRIIEHFARRVDSLPLAVMDKTSLISEALDKWLGDMAGCAENHCVTRDHLLPLPGVEDVYLAEDLAFGPRPQTDRLIQGYLRFRAACDLPGADLAPFLLGGVRLCRNDGRTLPMTIKTEAFRKDYLLNLPQAFPKPKLINGDFATFTFGKGEVEFSGPGLDAESGWDWKDKSMELEFATWEGRVVLQKITLN